MSDPGSFLKAARERHLFRYAVFYAGAAWAIAQVIEFFLDNYGWSQRVLDIALFLLAVGFLVTCVLAWYHGEKGLQRVQRSEAGVLAVLGVLGAVGVAWLSVRDIAPDLADGIDPAVDLGPNSVAVLPFRNEIGSPEFAWLDRGVAELLATDLSQLDSMRVVSGQRIFDVLRQLGVEDSGEVPEAMRTQVTRRAGARYMLTGSIVGGPGNVQLVAELSDTETGAVRASSRARGGDIFALVDQVSARISAEVLGRDVGADELAPVSRLTTRNLEAYREYAEGRDARFRFFLTEAREHFERAVELDSTFALAHFQLANLGFSQGQVGMAIPHLQAAERHLDTASERDRLMVGGLIDLALGRAEAGRARLQELLTKYPDEKDARIILSSFLQAQGGSLDEAERLVRETVALDPLYADGWNQLAYFAARRGDFEAADSLVRRYVALEPDQPNPLDSKGEIFEQAGRYDSARAAYRAALELREDFIPALSHLVRVHLREGRPADARTALQPYRVSESADTRVMAWWLTADTRMWEGEVEAAMATYDSTVAVAATTGRRDLHGQLLDQIIRTLILLERHAEAAGLADSLRALRGPDGITSVASLHLLGGLGRFEEMERLRDGMVEGMSSVPGLSSYARRAELGGDLLIAHYRGEHERAVALAAEMRAGSSFPVIQFGYPGIRSALAVGDAMAVAEALPGLPASVLQRNFRLAPLVERHRVYFEARLAELEGDTAGAVARYDELIREWGDGLEAVPLFRDVRSRRAALEGGSG